MQGLDLPTGVHNPNGYTAAEILSELRGIRGSRMFTYRYELLDDTDTKIRDLTEVEACTVEQDWLADIKRTATFTIRDTTDIDWLSDRIKPWIRLRMPARVQDTGQPIDVLWTNTCDGPTGAVTPANSLTRGDPFSTVSGTVNYMTSWFQTGTGSLSFGNASGSASGSVALGIPARQTWRMIFYANIPVGGYFRVAFETVGGDLVEDLVFDDSGGTYTLGTADVSLIKSHLFGQAVRIEVTRDLHRANYRLYWTSPTATVADYTAAEDASSWADVHRFRIFGGGHGHGPALIDEPVIGIPDPDDPESIPRIRPVWINGFNGTPGVQATVSNMGSLGSPPAEVNGVCSYSSDWSVDSLRSLQLGDMAGTNSGEIRIEIPHRDRWSLQFYAKIPYSGRLFVLPSGDEAISPPVTVNEPPSGAPQQQQWRDPNWIIFDDLNHEYSIAGTNISDAASGGVVGQQVRVELETDGEIYHWRVYWTDATGRAPDRSWAGSAADWVDVTTLLVSGGGDGSAPSLIDNLRIGDLLPTSGLTPDSVNFVEWPQGVFLLSSPQRSLDEYNTVSREVTGYDKLQILNDDLIGGHVATAGILAVGDTFKRTVTGTWGTADSGQAWSNVSVANTTVSVGRNPRPWGSMILTSAVTVARQIKLVKPDLTDTGIRVSMGVSATPVGGGARIGVSLRNQGAEQLYAVFANIATSGAVTLEAYVYYSGGSTQLATAASGLTLTAGQFVEIRARVIGHRIQARAWIDGSAEPTTWLLDTTVASHTLDHGVCGVITASDGTFTNTNLEFRWRSFQVSQAPLGRYTDLVATLIGDLPAVITPSSAVLPADMEWDAGTSKLKMINDLLAAVNYESISVNEDGIFVVRPYLTPDQRPAEYGYADDEVSVLYPEMTQELDLFSVPNRFILVVSEPDRDPVRVVYENRDPSSLTSIPNRGRAISSYVTDATASDRATLLETAVRHGFESSQVYEALEFSTGAMPIHSGNDVYLVERGPLGVSSKYVEQSWSLKFEAGAPMAHRARRVISFDTSFDDTILVDDLVVTGSLEAANMAWGAVSITTVANTPTSATLTGLDLQGTGPTYAAYSVNTTSPGSAVKEGSVYSVSPSGMVLFIYRTTATSTGSSWLMIREP